ncbi:hypothetical protein [Pedobacter sp. L105]|uniref:hypothetical protein n=1 Tax=Pedobacter sp. L105 TaxID=1641871 RepID=UPI00131EB141|nr:hypothetical protein [Pedobacter sp. L105]
MAFNVSALSEQIQLEDGFKIATKGVSQAKLAKALIASLNYQAGVITSAPIIKFDTTVTFQKQGCGRTAIGDTSFGEKYVNVASLAVYKDYCYKDFEGTYMAQALIRSDDPEEAVLMSSFTTQIIDKDVALINAAVEVALFQGDTTITGATAANLNKFDGIVKQVVTTSGNTATVVTGATIVEKLQALYMAMPDLDKLQEDAYVFISDALYEEYKLALWAKNMYREDGNLTVAGTSIKLFPTAGLNGTRTALALRLSNLQLAFNGSPETTGFDLWYSKDDNIFKENTFFSVGIAVVYPEDVRYTTV